MSGCLVDCVCVCVCVRRFRADGKGESEERAGISRSHGRLVDVAVSGSSTVVVVVVVVKKKKKRGVAEWRSVWKARKERVRSGRTRAPPLSFSPPVDAPAHRTAKAFSRCRR